MKHIDLFENIPLATKPHIIKASPKSDMAIIWFDIWDTQNSSKAKLLINHSFNLDCHITMVRATNMNPGVPQCHNCWKWGHSTFSCRAHGSRCCHKLHSVISPSILRRFPQSQSQLKALKKTFRSMPVTSRGDQ